MNTVAEKPAEVTSTVLVTMDPQKYVAEVFASFGAQLDAYKVRAASATYDVKTTAGMKIASELRAEGRNIRVASEKARKERKAPILEIGKLLDSRQKEIEAEIEPLETRFDTDIKAEEARKEAARMEKINAEIERTTAIRKRIATLQSWPADLAGQSWALMQDEIVQLEAVVIDESFAEFAPEALAIKETSLAKMRAMLAAAAAKEAEEIRLHEERKATAERQRAEDERLTKEREAIAQQRAADDARRAEEDRKAADRIAAAEREIVAAREKQRAAEDAGRAELQRQQDELAAARRAQLDEEEAAQRKATAAQAEADRLAHEVAEAEAARIRAAAEEAARQQLAAAAAAERRAEEERAAREAADTKVRNAAQALFDACKQFIAATETLDSKGLTVAYQSAVAAVATAQ